ncbi:MAG: prolyl oligopeptidase family serine peptidase [Bacillota bacterium]
METGWTLPERFCAKARDGVTDIYGIILRPSNFDPSRPLPVLDDIYAGPQTNRAHASFAHMAEGRGTRFWQAQAHAELGFVVVMIDGLGMPYRWKAYHDVSFRNLGDGGVEDHIAALRQLAVRYPYMDLERVGIYGHSAGGYSSCHAILAHPDFFKVAVSSAGNHDHRLDKASWVERYMGLPVGQHYDEQANSRLAHNLRGKLLLIHGEMDENVHVGSTMQVVDALIKANRDFDMLILPNRSHACTDDPYFIRKRWDYFVRHLLGAEPPEGYQIGR